jgi:D-alanine transaminase
MTQQIVFLNGDYVPKTEARISPDDRGFLFGDGVYEVVRAYGGSLFERAAHLARMRDGMAAMRMSGWESLDLESLTDELLRRNDLTNADATVYLQVTRGAAPRVHRFPDSDVPLTVYGFAAPIVRRGDPNGIKVITTPDLRWARCDIKSINLLGNCFAAQRAFEAGAVEAILVRDGVALEGSASSLFAVFDGEVRTAPRSNYILPSITRAVALELCGEAGIPARETPIFESSLVDADELFLAGTTVELMPIIRVNDQVIGDGRPGPVNRRLTGMLARRTGAAAVPV